MNNCDKNRQRVYMCMQTNVDERYQKERLLTNRLGIQRTQSTNTQRQHVLTPSPI
ncbi:unnamed protein product, partial [Rotaria sp. Silwood2]